MAWKTELRSKWASLVVVFLVIGCGGKVRTRGGTPSDGDAATGFAPPPSAKAAVSFSTSPTPGHVCTETTPVIGFPSDESTKVESELYCSSNTGCKHDTYAIVDGVHGATVTCTVSPQGLNFAVQLSLDVDGSATNEPSVSFGVSGLVSPGGGMVHIDESNSVAGGGGSDYNCTLGISPPTGLLTKGKVWGDFECGNITDVNRVGDTGCDLRGKLLFENCGE